MGSMINRKAEWGIYVPQRNQIDLKSIQTFAYNLTNLGKFLKCKRFPSGGSGWVKN